MRYKLEVEIEADSLNDAWEIASQLPSDLRPSTSVPIGLKSMALRTDDSSIQPKSVGFRRAEDELT